MSALSFLGRLLIATAIVSSAYIHYQHPAKNTDEFIANYNAIDKFSNQFLEFDIPLDNVEIEIHRPIGLR
jgi:hypothetical protein